MNTEQNGAAISDPARIAAFIEGGNATFTLKNIETGGRFTYKVVAVKDPRVGGPSHFVKVMNGSDDESDFAYIGQIYPEGGPFAHGRKSAISMTAPSVKTFAWLRTRLSSGAALPPQVEFWHAGKCGRCGRTLTVPESIKDSGFGPECASRMGG